MPPFYSDFAQTVTVEGAFGVGLRLSAGKTGLARRGGKLHKRAFDRLAAHGHHARHRKGGRPMPALPQPLTSAIAANASGAVSRRS